MRKHNLYLFASVIPASVMLASGAAAQSLWSDPNTWPSGEVPGEGDAVEITRDMDVVLDVDAPGLRSLTIQGKLSFSDERDISLESEWIYVPGGELQIGTAAFPYQHNATITLTDNVPGEDINTMGDRGIMLMQGTLNMHGDRDHTWSKLSQTAEAGATTITVLDGHGWHVGDEIVLASTDFDPRQAERRTITAIDGNTISFAQPLEYMHFGEITFGVDERGEVGNLTRNIKVQASEDAAETYFGGHIMAMSGSRLYVDSVELNRMGQHLTLARYPIHFHVLGEGSGMYVRNAAIHDTFNRCVTVHGTDNLDIENNVTFNTVGHCFFMEDGIEKGNKFIANLGIQTKCHPTLPCLPTNLGVPSERTQGGQQSEHVLIPSDNTVATYWITNPANHYIDNVAAGSDSTGFWLSLPEHPTGQFEGTEISAQTWPRRTPLGIFRGNTAHSNYDGFMFDRNAGADGTFGVTGTVYIQREDPSDGTSRPIVNLITDLTAYKNRNGGLWGRGEETIFRDMKFADNAIGMTFATGLGGGATFTSHTEDSLFVGESANVGNPSTPEELAYGRSLPKPQVADYPIRGYEYYDQTHSLQNNTFVNFTDNDTRKTGAISYLLFTSFGMSVDNSVESLEFINAKPVFFPERRQEWASDFGTSAAFLTAAIHDIDGTTSGVPDSYIVYDNGIANDDEACELKPDWGAAVCTGDYGRLSLGGGFAFGGGAVEDPVTIRRNGRDFDYRGQTTIRSGAEIEVDTTRETVPMRLSSMDDGSWIMVQLPGFTGAEGGVEQSSLAALRAADVTSYYKDANGLWVKLYADNNPVAGGGGPFNIPPSLTASREGLGG